MRDAQFPFPTSYKLDETCVSIATSTERARSVGAAAIEAIAGYRIEQGQLTGVVSGIRPMAAREGDVA